MDYTGLSLTQVRAALEDISRDAQATFGALDERQLNWRPSDTQWSVAQCFEHLLMANRLMFQSSDDALKGTGRNLWQRMPILPGLFGAMMIRSQTPESARKFTAASTARPAASAIGADIIPRFVEQHRQAALRLQALDERDAARIVMTSPFLRIITYSILDGMRLVVAHDRRHFEQARRVTVAQGFPRS